MAEIDDPVMHYISGLSDRDLIQMLAASPGNYRSEALVFAKAEAQRRGLEDISTNAITRLEEQERRRMAQATKDHPPLEPVSKARGLRASFDICCVFVGFPIARFISLAIPADKPDDFALYSRVLFFVCGFGGLAVGDLLFRNMIAPRRSKTARGLLAALVMIPSFLFYTVGTQIGKTLQSRHMAVDSVRHESKMENAPTGFGNATWLMSKAQVRAVFPNSVEFGGTDALSIQTTAFKRPAIVGFMFKDDLLLQIVITFTGDKTEETYQRTHKLVELEYGVLPPRTPTGQFTRSSEKRYARAIVQHLLYTNAGIPIEQVILYRTEADATE